MQPLELMMRAQQHGQSTAVRCEAGVYTYDDLLHRSQDLAAVLLGDEADLGESRVAFLVPPSFEYVAVQWAVWQAGGVAVPLSLSATEPELESTLVDARPVSLVVSRSMFEKVTALCARLGIFCMVLEEMDATTLPSRKLPKLDLQRPAMMLYTSGTTSRPKGVVSTHANIQAQIESLVQAWEWRSSDCIPLFLPLHHIHGIINVLCCALWSGATVDMFPRFDMEPILERVAERNYSIFMAVPTIYVMLIQKLNSLTAANRERVVGGFAQMRLMVSGSAALPASVHQAWTTLTGQPLLERYGMTEIGMALGNPYHGERRPGTVGLPLPGVEIRLVSEQGQLVTQEEEPGEIQVRGATVFAEYWNRPQATAEAFKQGWFCTGDMAVVERGYYRIMGRQSIDIIKSGGYKLSALEIEAVLLEHPAICEVAVIGLADETWGEAVAAAVVLHPGETLDVDALRGWCRERLSKYKLPQRLAVVDALPRNAMGKITKPAVRHLFE